MMKPETHASEPQPTTKRSTSTEATTPSMELCPPRIARYDLATSPPTVEGRKSCCKQGDEAEAEGLQEGQAHARGREQQMPAEDGEDALEKLRRQSQQRDPERETA